MMDNRNYYKEIDNYTYSEYVHYLKKKYGAVMGNYFTDQTCVKRNRLITRYKDDGLFIHHIKENKGFFLSKTEQAIKYPFEYQLAKNLVYCNILEHYILHLKIYIFTEKKFGTYGVRVIEKELLDFYYNGVCAVSWEKSVCNSIYDCENMFKYFYKKYRFVQYLIFSIKNAIKVL